MINDILFLFLVILMMWDIHSLEKKVTILHRQVSALYLFVQKKFDFTPAEVIKMCSECTNQDLDEMDKVRK